MSAWWDVPATLAMQSDIIYSSPPGGPLRLDVFRPPGSDVLPGVLALVGGGWRQCNRPNIHEVCRVVASAGYVVAAPSYRIAPQHPWPACLQDVKTALRWFRANAATYGVDPLRIGAIGSSAGAHLAAMLAVTPPTDAFGGTQYLAQPSHVAASVCLCAPTDMTSIYDWHKDDGVALGLLGKSPEEVPEVYRNASPISYVSAACAPCMFIHGDVDKTVQIEPARKMSQMLRDCGVDSPFITLEGVGHGVRGFIVTNRERSPMPQILDFLARHVQGRKPTA